VAGEVEVWEEEDGLWRWRYRDDEGVDLLSNESHLTRDEAIHAASVAYPGVPVRVKPPARAGARRRSGLGTAIGRAIISLLAVVAAVPVGIVLLWRRLTKALRR
jgi:ubiquinol-cytochrome c reductase cytochrome b subunit